MAHNLDNALIVKKILYAGTKNAKFVNGTKVCSLHDLINIYLIFKRFISIFKRDCVTMKKPLSTILGKWANGSRWS